MRFNITTIRPKGFLHSSAFAEVIDSLAWALTALDHEAVITHNWISNLPTETNIVFGTELLADSVKLPPNTIIYNLEQPSHPNMAKVARLAKGLTVWDTFATNVATWLSYGYRAHHVPIGYTRNLTRIPRSPVQDIDILFCGWLTPRRRQLVDELRSAGLKVYATDCAYGGARDNLIARSRIVLNIHHDGRNLLEIVRISYLLANSKCVVSEISADESSYPQFLTDSFIRAPYESIVEVCRALLTSQNNDIKFWEDSGLEGIQGTDYISTVHRALTDPTPHEKVAARYAAACTQGDMKDFAPWLAEHAKGTILEIGVRDGASTSAFLTGIQQNGGTLLSLDIADCSQLFAGHPQWKFLQTDSRNPKLHVPPLDLLLIDGDHTRDGYRADLERFYPLVKPGGLILSHDIAPEPGQTLEDAPGSDFPSTAIREEYFAFADTHHLAHEELPGKYGLGVMTKPATPDIDECAPVLTETEPDAKFRHIPSELASV